MIPNIVHFIYGFQEQTVEFEYYKYMAVKSAAIHINPDVIYFWYNHIPFGEYWEKTKLLVQLRAVDPPEFIFGNPIHHYAHKSDVVRLSVLRDYGGIYLDIDTICVKSFKPLMKHNFVIAKQDKLRYCNAVMLSRPNNRFVVGWYNSYKSFRSKGKDNYWDEHSCLLPRKLIQEFPKSDVTVLKQEAFFPIAFSKYTDIFTSKRSILNSIMKTGVYCLHLWETKSYEMLVNDFKNDKLTVLTYLYENLAKTIECYTTISTTCNVSLNMQSIIDSWKTNILFTSQTFTDMECLDMIKEYGSERLLEAYLKVIPGAFRSDIWRLFQLYRYGGLYRDSHIECINHEKLQALCLEYDGVFVRDDITNTKYIYNAFMYLKNPKDPLISAVLETICQNIFDEIYPVQSDGKGCLAITGPVVHGKVLFDMGRFDPKTNILSFCNKRYYILTHKPIKQNVFSEQSVIRMERLNILKSRYPNYREDIELTYNGLKGYPAFFENRMVYAKKTILDVVIILRDVEAYCEFMKGLFVSIERVYPHIELRFQIYESDSTDSTYLKCKEFLEKRRGNLYSEQISMQKFYHEVSSIRGNGMTVVRNNLKKLHGELDSDFVLVMDSRILFNPTCILSMMSSLQFDSGIGLISGYGRYQKSTGPYYDTLALILNKKSYYNNIDPLHRLLLRSKKNRATIECEACFGGMAMMPTWVYNKSKYWVDPSSPKDSSNKKGLPCEHHGFCKDIRNLNMRVVLDPRISFNKYNDSTSCEEYEEEFNNFI